MGSFRSTLRSLKILRAYSIGKLIQMSLKNKWEVILMKNLTDVITAIGFIIKEVLLILLALTTCTCSGVRSTLVIQTTEKPIDSSLYSGKPVRLIQDVTECATLKTDGVDSHLWHQVKPLTIATISSDARFGILSKSGSDAKKMFTDKVVPISLNYPFFFKPIQDGMDRPKTELAYRVPASKLTT